MRRSFRPSSDSPATSIVFDPCTVVKFVFGWQDNDNGDAAAGTARLYMVGKSRNRRDRLRTDPNGENKPDFFVNRFRTAIHDFLFLKNKMKIHSLIYKWK